MAPLVWGSQGRHGAALLAAVKQHCGDNPCCTYDARHKCRILERPAVRWGSLILLLVILLHQLATHRHLHSPTVDQPTAAHILNTIHLPSSKDLPKQVEFYSTCPTDMPLLSEKDSVLTPDELTALQKALRNSSWLVPLGRRTGKVGTKGVAVTFNIGGVDLMLQAANLSEMAWFFHRERLPSANAWTMTLVATEACPGFQAEQGIWAIHQDELRAAKGGAFEAGNRIVRIAPHSVTVFAVEAPEHLQGGATWLWEPNSTLMPSSAPPSAIVQPKPNSMVAFRGDVFHGITGQNSTRPGPLISLVLEQYKVPTALYSQTEEFSFRRFKTEHRAKRPDRRVYHPVTEEQRRVAARLLKGLQD